MRKKFALLWWAVVSSFSAALSPLAYGDILTALVAYYPLDGTPNDASGNARNGAASNVTYVAGRVGAQAAAFNDVDSAIIVAALANNLPAANSARTVAFWMQQRSTTNGNMVSWGTRTNNNRFSALTEGNGQLRIIGESNDYNSTAFIPSNTWRHVAITYNSTSLTFYVDGVVSGVSTPTAFATAASGDLRIGRNASPDTDEFFGGYLDDVRVYNRALTAADVAELFAFQTYVVTATAPGADSGGSVSCTSPVNSGASSTCTAIPDPGYSVSSWTGSCAAAGASATCNLTNVSANQSSTVNFAPSTIGVCGAAAGVPSVVAPTSALCAAGTASAVTSASGTHSWTCQGSVAAITTDDAACSSTQTFSINTGGAISGGAITCAPASAAIGQTITCTATPNSGFSFGGFTGACTGTGACIITVTGAGQAVSGSFAPLPPTQVPTLGEWTRGVLALLLIGVAAFALRRRSRI